jgi:hypothetical protein
MPTLWLVWSGDGRLTTPKRELLDLDTKVCLLLEAEYLRRLRQYRRVDYFLTQKYEMTFEEFTVQRVAQREGYTWDVETDAMDWETAVGGMKMMMRKLQELRESRHAHNGGVY